jgi:hypothetical protein
MLPHYFIGHFPFALKGFFGNEGGGWICTPADPCPMAWKLI